MSNSVDEIIDKITCDNPFGFFENPLDVLRSLWYVSVKGIDRWAEDVIEVGGKGIEIIIHTDVERESFDKEFRFFLIIGVWSVVEDQLRRLAKALGFDKQKAPIWQVSKYIGESLIPLTSLPGFNLTDDSRIIANCYKHNAGMSDTEWAKKHNTNVNVVLMAPFELYGSDVYKLRIHPLIHIAAARSFLISLRREWSLSEAKRLINVNSLNKDEGEFILNLFANGKGLWV